MLDMECRYKVVLNMHIFAYIQDSDDNVIEHGLDSYQFNFDTSTDCQFGLARSGNSFGVQAEHQYMYRSLLRDPLVAVFLQRSLSHRATNW